MNVISRSSFNAIMYGAWALNQCGVIRNIETGLGLRKFNTWLALSQLQSLRLVFVQHCSTSVHS